MRLYEPDRHEALTRDTWNEGAARAAIAAIVADAEDAFTENGLWPIHPLDVSNERADVLKTLYYGAAGVIWALWRLEETGAARLTRDYLPALRTLPAAHDADFALKPTLATYVGGERRSFFCDALGMRMLEHKRAPTSALETAIAADIATHLGDLRGLLWGGAGMMCAARFMHARTGEARWRDAFLRHANSLWERLTPSSALGCRLWSFELYGDTATRIGALHGFFSAAHQIVAGRDLLDPALRDEALGDIYAAFTRTALVDGPHANWPYTTDGLGAGVDQPRYLQFCVGAPGVLCAMAAFPDDPRWPVNDLLRAGGELVWCAGPLTKLPSLCHGVPGAGYAFLKLYARFGEPTWLDRARAFAMHAIAQAERSKKVHGQRKFSLWTGDLGLAVFLDACIRADPDVPTLDDFELNAIPCTGRVQQEPETAPKGSRSPVRR